MNSQKNYKYRKISDFIPGDTVHRWGDDLEVISVQYDGKYMLIVKDLEGHKRWLYSKDVELLSKLREDEVTKN